MLVGDTALQLDSDAQLELRERLNHGQGRLPLVMSAVLSELAAEPMTRMSQAELAKRLGLERTRRFDCSRNQPGLPSANSSGGLDCSMLRV